MKKEDYLVFLNKISKDKPNDIKGHSCECPFCQRQKLQGIIDEEGPYLFLKNKYPTLADCDQFVIVETYSCKEHMGMYSEDYMKQLIRFSVKHYYNMINNKEYKSVIFYKNHGENSGGSLKHSHMQIVGLKSIDYKENVNGCNFCGIKIKDNNRCQVSLSEFPLNAFNEFNIIIDKNLKYIDEFAASILKCVKYILYDYFAPCNSFNLFFYVFNESLICKVCPRFVTSPLLLGYNIKQVSDCILEVADSIKNKYFNE